MTLKLYFNPGSAAMAPNALMEEAGLDYELISPERNSDESVAGSYLALNPSGRLPTLVDGELVVFETGAILLYLLSKPSAQTFAPRPGTPEFVTFLQWLFYLTTTPQVTLIEYHYPSRWAATPEDEPRVMENAISTLARHFDLLEAHVADGTFLPGGFSVLDIHLTMLARWTRDFSKPMGKWPKLGAIIENTRNRPAFLRMMERQGIAWPVM